MDTEKLKRLRARYADRGAFDGDDPVLLRAARDVQTADGRRTLPFSGVATSLELPLDGLDIAVVGVPMDLGVSNRAGARFGPRAVRTIERIGPYHPTFRGVPKGRARAADVGDVPFHSRYDLERSLQDIEAYYSVLRARGVRPLSVGGDHSITYPILKALGKEAPLGLVHIDTHCDTMGAYDDTKFHHGGPFRLAVLDGVLDPDRTIQIGIRGAANMFWEFSHASGMTVIYMEDFMRMGVAAVIEKARTVVGDQPV
jgi:guanidinopropionase